MFLPTAKVELNNDKSFMQLLGIGNGIRIQLDENAVYHNNRHSANNISHLITNFPAVSVRHFARII
jgi:hypothetical protein